MRLNMRSLLSVVIAVLNDEQIIPELPNNKIVAYQNRGQPIAGHVNNSRAFLKVARLQTIIVQEQEKSELPEVIESTSSASAALMVQEDATHTIMMLERLIVQIVRDAYPSESERFGVRYVADIGMGIFYTEAPQRRFLD
jgi:hypothetical protein